MMSTLKGWWGEKKATFTMWMSLDKATYQRLHDVIIPSSNGTTQIDHILLSEYGIFIVETKNYQGWIFGSEDSAKWTQVLRGKKYPFQNPLRQAYRQKKVLCEFLGIEESLVRIVVFFVGDCQFKTEMPQNVLSGGLAHHVKSYNHQVFSPRQVDTLKDQLLNHKRHTSLNNRDHIQSLRDRHSSTTICPTCGGKLVTRTIRKGAKAGSQFLGCSNYPKCRFTKQL